MSFSKSRSGVFSRPSIFLGSLCAAAILAEPAIAQLEPQDDYFVAEGSVDLLRGNLMLSSVDLSVGPADAPHVQLVRQHGIDVTENLFSGGGSTHNHNIWVVAIPYLDPLQAHPNYSYEYRVVIGQDVITFKQEYPNSTATYQGGKGGTHKLVLAGRANAEKYIGPNGEEYDFGAAATHPCPTGSPPNCFAGLNKKGVVSSKLPDGREFTYHRTGTPTALSIPPIAYISSNHGYGLGFEYMTEGFDFGPGWITKVCALNLGVAAPNPSQPCAGATVATTYLYDGIGPHSKLQDVVSPVGDIATYSYANSRIASITLDQQSAPLVSFQYHSYSSKLLSQTFADGSNRIYRYQTTDVPWVHAATNEWTEIELPDGSVRRYEFNGSWGSKPTATVDELGRRTEYTYAWAPFNTAVMTSKTLPGGQRTEYTHGVRTNVTETRQIAASGSSLSDIVTKADFVPSTPGATAFCDNPIVCEKPIWTEDANGNRTDFTYDPVHGGVLKRTLPADATGVRPQTRYSYAQKYAWLKSGGGFVQAATPIWVLVAEEFCRSSAADINGNCAAGASDEVVTTYEYEQGSSTKGSHVLLLGKAVTADGQTLRTCYGYDQWGRRVSETQPKGVSGVCS